MSKTSKRKTAVAKPAPSSLAGWIRPSVEALTALFILGFVVPWQPASEAPIGQFDFSWMLLLHDAIATGRQFGRQIILPQGPLGFLGNSVYDPRTYWILIAGRTLMALSAFWCIRAIGRKFVSQPFFAFAWISGIILLIGFTPDHFFPACAALLVITYFEVDGRKLVPHSFALIVTLAASSLIKVNQPFYAIVAIGALTVDQVAQRRRNFFVPGATYLAAIVVFYFAARQSPLSVGAFLWGWMEVSFGHANAVGLPGPAIDPICYLFIVALVTALIGFDQWKRARWVGMLLTAALLAMFLLLYKHSFMRFDISHVHMGPMVLTAVSLVYLTVLWNRHRGIVRGMAIVNTTLAATFLSSIFSSYTPKRGLLGYIEFAMTQCGQNIMAATSHLTDPTRLHREWEAARAQLRAESPLPVGKILGTVDVYPHRQDIVFAYDLNYQPRPVVSSLVATSPTLADLNARHLRGDHAPMTVLLDIQLVDYNYPTMLDGESIPELLTRYDLIDFQSALLVLRKSPAPRPWHLEPMAHQTGRLDEPLSLPSATAPIWARIHLKRSSLEPLLGAIYKPASASIHVRTHGGDEEDYRLLPSLAEQGFLLSPLLKDRTAFARLMRRSWAQDLRADVIEQITITVESGFRESAFEPGFDVELFGLEFEHQN